MKETTIPAKAETNVPDTREESRTLIPAVDIFETNDGLVVVADLPGVETGTVDVGVEKNILTIKAKPAPGRTGDLTLQEYRLLPYFRQFQLSEIVDQEKIRAELKFGVLTIHLQNRGEKQPRKIAVNLT